MEEIPILTREILIVYKVICTKGAIIYEKMVSLCFLSFGNAGRRL